MDQVIDFQPAEMIIPAVIAQEANHFDTPPDEAAAAPARDLYYPALDQAFELTYRAGNRRKVTQLCIKPLTDKVLYDYQGRMHTRLQQAHEMLSTTSNAMSVEHADTGAGLALFDAVCPTNRDLPDNLKLHLVRDQILFAATNTPFFETDEEAALYPAEGTVIRLLARFNNVPIITEHIFREITKQHQKDYELYGGKTIFGSNTTNGAQDILIVAKPSELKQLYLRLILETRGYDGDQMAQIPLHHMTAALTEVFKIEVTFNAKNV